MAPTARSFCFVFLLLAGDWYFDTSQGLSTFDGPLSSTTVTCRSLADKRVLCKRFDATDLTQPAVLLVAFQSQTLPTGVTVPATSPRVLSGPTLACLFMSFQC